MSGRPTIKDIAEKAGVSPATVSRALSDSGLVTDATRQRVHDIARAMNYRPNVQARNLRTRRSMAVLLVVRNVGNPFYLDIMKGVEEVARQNGYSVLMGNTEDDPHREAEYVEMLRDGHADGMILMTGRLPAVPDSEQGGLDGLPIVVALEIFDGAILPHVQIDNAGGARNAVRYLIGLGHRRIAHITGPLPETMSIGRRDGYRQALAEAGIAFRPEYEAPGNYRLESGQEAVRRLFALPEPPTAIFAANDEMAMGAAHELSRMHIDVPGSVSIIGFDDLYLSRAFHPPLTTIRQPCLDIGRTAMRVLTDMLAGAEPSPEPVIMPTELIIRASTAPLKQ